MYEIPTEIKIGENFHAIRNKGDYRMVLECFAALEDEDLSKQERLMASLIIFYDGMEEIEDLGRLSDLETAVRKMFIFFNCGSEDNSQRNPRIVDWAKDEQIISAAVNKVCGHEIRLEPYVHWWTFMGYYMSVGESLLSTVLGIRQKIVKGKKLEKYEKQFRRENPQYFIWDRRTLEDKEADKLIREMWNSGE